MHKLLRHVFVCLYKRGGNQSRDATPQLTTGSYQHSCHALSQVLVGTAPRSTSVGSLNLI